MSDDGFIPRHARASEEKIEACAAAVEAAHEVEVDAVLLASFALLALHQDGDELARHRAALDEVMTALADFDERCGAGDVTGAVVELRGWLGRVRG